MYDFKAIEKEVLSYWEANKIYRKAKEKNKGKKPFYYLDGPPYTSGRIHLGHAWGKALRDALMRYKRMSGFDVWDRSGFDMHGLPTEKAAENELGLKSKEDVENYGVERYIKFCEKLALDNMNLMIRDFKYLGVWMDFENPYMSINPEYIEGIWWLVKTAHDKGRLYEGFRTIPWCASCGTANAKHELEYKNIKEESIFIKFKISGTKNEYLIVWTTTPWTIPFNLAVMVNPDLDYVKCKVENEYWIVAKLLANVFISGVVGKQFVIVSEFKGKEIEGLKYEHPLGKFIPYFLELEKENKSLHTVVLSREYVNTSAGTGLVHCAPGCGPEDYEVGHLYGLPAYNTLNEDGTFDENMPEFKGLKAKVEDNIFVEALEHEGALITTTEVEHEYPHCWRCHLPVIFRATKQWFFKIEDLKENMKKLNKKIYWVPEWAGSRQFHSWLDNLRDNSISKQRYWGTPLPIWRCNKCGNYDVIGSAKELEKLAGYISENLHKPWIDKVEYNCKCGGVKKRLLDVIDVWVDAGCSSWLCVDYPRKKELFEKLYPPDFILEGKDQIRGWFNILFVASMIAFNRISYKAVYMHGFIDDSQGRKMSKSLGNYIRPDEVLSNFGVDACRYYMIGGANPGTDLNYNLEDIKIKFRNLDILWNLADFVISYAKTNNFKGGIKPKKFSIEERYMLSKLHNGIKNVKELFDKYYLDLAPLKVEEIFLELSRTYIQFVREKSVSGNLDDKKAVFYTVFNSLFNVLKIFAPITPIITERIYLKLRKEFGFNEESIHLFNWPKFDAKKIDIELEKKCEIIKEIIQAILAVRDKEKIGVRWALGKANVFIQEEFTGIISNWEEIIKVQTNVKEIKVINIKKEISSDVLAGGFSKGYVELDLHISKELEQEGFARELIRRIQALRKEAKLERKDKVELNIVCDYDFGGFEKEIKEKVGASKIKFLKEGFFDFEFKELKKIKEKDFRIFMRKI